MQYYLLSSSPPTCCTPRHSCATRCAHCQELLQAGGALVANEEVAIFDRPFSTTTRLHNTTFALTDGWWLFGLVDDRERVGQDSPLLSWRQWQSLLDDSGFKRSHCMQGSDFLLDQAVLVAQIALPVGAVRSPLDESAHLLSGGVGGLGLLQARLLIESGAGQLVLASPSGSVEAGSESG